MSCPGRSGSLLSISHCHCGSTLRSVRLRRHCGSTFQYVPAISSRYCTATVAVPCSTEPIIAKEPDKTIALRPESLISPNSNATSSFYSPCRVKIWSNMIVTVKKRSNRASGPTRAFTGVRARGACWQHKRRDKNHFFFKPEIRAYINTLPVSPPEDISTRQLAAEVFEHASICSPAWELEFISTIAQRTLNF